MMTNHKGSPDVEIPKIICYFKLNPVNSLLTIDNMSVLMPSLTIFSNVRNAFSSPQRKVPLFQYLKPSKYVQ